MPLFNLSHGAVPLPPAPPEDNPPIVIDTASLFSNNQYSQNPIGVLDGSPYTVLYYTQYLGNVDPVINVGDITDPTLKQYLKINNFELRLTAPLSFSTDSGLGTSITVAEANVYPVITPISGDVFIGLIQDGIYGVFEVTTVTRASLFKQSAWKIEFSQIAYMDEHTIAHYDGFAVAEVYFDIDQLIRGENPLSTATEHNRVSSKQQLIVDLIEEYYLLFYDKLSATFIKPGNINAEKCYDKHLIHFWNTLVEADYFPGGIKPVLYHYDSVDNIREYLTIFDVLLKQSLTSMKHVVRVMRHLSAAEFAAIWQRNTIHITNIYQVVTPYIADNKATRLLAEYPVQNDALLTPYVLTNSFYDTTIDRSPLEIELTKGIKQEAINYNDCVNFITTRDTLSDVEKFYHFPLFIYLLKLAR